MENFFIILKAIILGIVEGITEWLPISSTGHMILVDAFLKLGTREEFTKLFLVVIQLGAILAVVVLYFEKLNPFSPKKSVTKKKKTWILWIKVIVAAMPAAVIGLLFDDQIDALLDSPLVVAITLVLYGVLFIVIERYNENREPSVKKLSELPYKTAFLIGLFQILAMIPGTSRSGATILGGLLIGTSRYVATEFTFFLAIPVMVGASGLKLLKFLLEYKITGFEITILLIGMVTAFLVSIMAIKFLMRYIKKKDFKMFGYYRIVLGVMVLLYFFINK